jgi:hypothetical protein
VKPCPLAAIGPAIFGLALLFSSSALAEVSVAVAPVSGPKRTGAVKIGKAVRTKLTQGGLQLISDRALAGAAKKLGVSPAPPQAADEAGADLLVVVSTRKAGKKLVAGGKLIDVSSGKVLRTVEETYKKGGAANAGAAIGGELANVAASFKPAPRAAARSRESVPASRSRAIAAKDEGEVEAPREKRAAPAVIPKDEVKGGSAKVAAPSADSGSGESKVLRLSFGLGTQLASAYTVAVGGQSTGLAYNLNPLYGVAGGARVAIPSAGLSLDLGLSYVHVSYRVDVTPAVTPTNPSGRFLDFQAVLAYELMLSRFGAKEEKRFFVAPLLGVVYRSLSVERTVPDAIVLSSSALAPRIGGKLGLMLGSVALEAIGAADLVVSYNEEPEKTGQNGTGLGLSIGAAGRYWLSETFGVSLSGGYEYMKISMSGPGTRKPFVNDPQLLNASVFSGDWKMTLAAMLAL